MLIQVQLLDNLVTLIYLPGRQAFHLSVLLRDEEAHRLECCSIDIESATQVERIVLATDHVLIEGNMVQGPMPYNLLPQNLKAADNGCRKDCVLVACAGIFFEEVNLIFQFLLMASEKGVELVDLSFNFLPVFIAHARISTVTSDEVVWQLTAEYEAH